jgi:hypothetical protein
MQQKPDAFLIMVVKGYLLENGSGLFQAAGDGLSRCRQ